MQGRASWLKALAALAVGLVLCFAPLPPTQGIKASPSLAVRLFGPIATLAASAQWVRADLAFRSGRVELFLARAETALVLAPDSARGWRYLAWAQAFTLASPELEPNPERRLAWIRAGLATAAEGERVASAPADLAFVAGLIMAKTAVMDSKLPWPGGLPAILDSAADHFERAQRLGADAATASGFASEARRAAAVARDAAANAPAHQ